MEVAAVAPGQLSSALAAHSRESAVFCVAQAEVVHVPNCSHRSLQASVPLSESKRAGASCLISCCAGESAPSKMLPRKMLIPSFRLIVSIAVESPEQAASGRSKTTGMTCESFFAHFGQDSAH